MLDLCWPKNITMQCWIETASASRLEKIWVCCLSVCLSICLYINNKHICTLTQASTTQYKNVRAHNHILTTTVDAGSAQQLEALRVRYIGNKLIHKYGSKTNFNAQNHTFMLLFYMTSLACGGIYYTIIPEPLYGICTLMTHTQTYSKKLHHT